MFVTVLPRTFLISKEYLICTSFQALTIAPPCSDCLSFSKLYVLSQNTPVWSQRSVQSCFSSLDGAGSNFCGSLNLICVADFSFGLYGTLGVLGSLTPPIQYISVHLSSKFLLLLALSRDSVPLYGCVVQTPRCQVVNSEDRGTFRVSHIMCINGLLKPRLEQLWLSCPSLFANSKPCA